MWCAYAFDTAEQVAAPSHHTTVHKQLFYFVVFLIIFENCTLIFHVFLFLFQYSVSAPLITRGAYSTLYSGGRLQYTL